LHRFHAERWHRFEFARPAASAERTSGQTSIGRSRRWDFAKPCATSASLPKATEIARHCKMSRWATFGLIASQQLLALFDHRIGAEEDRLRHGEPHSVFAVLRLMFSSYLIGWMIFQCGQLGFHVMRKPFIIVIKKIHVISRGGR
jgi:hypothetical protein